MLLPRDVWLHIARFLPAATVQSLFPVNSALCNIALDARYRHVSLVYCDARLLRNLLRLGDPFIAPRVKILYLSPVFLVHPLPLHLKHHLSSSHQLVAAVLHVLRSLVSLTDYHLTWHGPPLNDRAVSLVAAPLLLPTLSKLFLDITLDNLHALSLASSFSALRIQQLHLHLHSDPSSSSSHILASLAHSLASLSPHIRLLAIQSRQLIDLGPFFTHLPPLSALDTLALALPLQKPHLGDPHALASFLNTHRATLASLRLTATHHHHHHSATPDPWSLHDWITTALHPNSLLHALTSLQVSSNLIPPESILYLTHTFAPTLESLSVLGSLKNFDFVQQLLCALSTPDQNRCLRTLKLGHVHFSPQLLDLLAHHLPNLLHLELIVKLFLPRQDDLPIYVASPPSTYLLGPPNQVQWHEQRFEFLETMQNQWSWPWWGLKTIAVFCQNSTLFMPLPVPLSNPPPPALSSSLNPSLSSPPAPRSPLPSLQIPPSISISTSSLVSPLPIPTQNSSYPPSPSHGNLVSSLLNWTRTRSISTCTLSPCHQGRRGSWVSLIKGDDEACSVGFPFLKSKFCKEKSKEPGAVPAGMVSDDVALSSSISGPVAAASCSGVTPSSTAISESQSPTRKKRRSKMWVPVPLNQMLIRMRNCNKSWFRENHHDDGERQVSWLKKEEREREIECARMRDVRLQLCEKEREKRERERERERERARKEREEAEEEEEEERRSRSSGSRVEMLSGDGHEEEEEDERRMITFQTALGEVLERCLPGVRVVG